MTEGRGGWPLAAWVRGLDPPIYLLSLFPPMVGAAAAMDGASPGGPLGSGAVRWGVAAAATVAFVLVHLAVNVFNDAFDAGTKADRVKHQSLARLAPVQTLHAVAATCLAFGCLIGIVLWLRVGHWHVPALSALGIALVFAYHAPPLRLSSRGWGEAVTFLGFGAIPVWTTAALATGTVPRTAWLPGIAMGLAASLVLWHHNVASASADGAAGKRTLASRMGRLASVGTVLLTIAAWACVAALWGRSAFAAGAALAVGIAGYPVVSGRVPRTASLGVYVLLAAGVLMAQLRSAEIL